MVGEVVMLNSGVRLGFGFLALALASSADAQGDLDQGKTAAQLYASACASCHKSPQSVTRTKWIFGLENFLRQHYTASSESAAVLAVYLKVQEKASTGSPSRHVAEHTSQTKFTAATVNEFGEEIPRPPANIPDLGR
jgi:cytochrome c553